VKRFALIRSDRIGDLVLSLPVAEAVKDVVPGAFVAFVVSPANSAIARACPFVDAVIEYSERADRLRGLLRLTGELRSGGFDAAIFLRPTPRAALAAALANVPLRVGTSYRFYSFLFNRRVPEHRKHAEKHEYESNLALIAAALKPGTSEYAPRLELDGTSRKYAWDTMHELGLERKGFVIIHPGSGGSARNLKPAGYAWLADYIENRMGVRAVLTYGPGEEHLIDSIDSARERESTRLRGPEDLIRLAGFIENAALFVSGSTGPMHIAAAVGTPTLSFFSPVRSCSPRRWGPVSDKRRVIMPPVPECPTCIGGKCEYYDCMDMIDLDAAAEAARDLLK
jgi:heptosyltransferase-3